MANLSLYYPAPIVAGTTAGTYADGASAAHVGLANTFTANQTFNGTNNVAPNQTAASGSSIMTRDLVDFRLFEQAEGLWVWRQGDSTSTVTGSAQVDAQGGISLFTGTTAGSVSLGRLQGGGGGGGATPMYDLDWSRPVILAGRVGASQTTPNGISRLQLGTPVGSTTPADLANKGIGLRCVGNSIALDVHNGSFGTTSASVGTLSATRQFFRIVSDGAGNVQLYLNRVLVASTSLGPTGAIVDAGLSASATNNADAAVQRMQLGLLKIWIL